MKNIISLLFVLLLFGCGSKQTEDTTTSNVIKTQINTPSVMCNMCVKTIKSTLEKIDGVKSVEVDLKNKITSVEYIKDQTDINYLVFAITEAGYDANDKKRNLETYEQLPPCCKDGKY